MTQNQRILSALRRGPLTAHEISDGLGGPWINDARKRISELRMAGYVIGDEWIGTKPRYKRYRLDKSLAGAA